MGQLRTHIDFEGRSLAQLPKVGEHIYAQHWSTSITMLQFYVPELTPLGVKVHDFMTKGAPGYLPSDYAMTRYPALNQDDFLYRAVKPACPPEILAAIARGDIFVAHNARFEQALWYWICHLQWGWPMIEFWSCTAARSRYMGIRGSLEGSGSDLEIDIPKDVNGTQFLKDFCKPRKYKGTVAEGIVKDLWYEPYENIAGWEKGLKYGARDVYATLGIDALLPDLPPFEQRIWELDERMNRRGMPIDLDMVRNAKEFSAYYTMVNFKRFDEIMGLRPTQRQKILDYIEQREDMATLGDLKSKTLKRIVQADLPPDMADAINIRLETSKASIKKLDSMDRCTDTDGFARGGYLYGGAHTLRWTAKRIQLHNLTRGDKDVAAAMFKFLESDCWHAGPVGHNGGPPLDEMPTQPAWIFEAGLRFPRPLAALSQSMRGFIAAPKGYKIVVADYAQIEARVLAWLARCLWLLQSFRDGDDIYVRFGAEHMYNRAYESCFYYEDGKRKVVPDFVKPRQVAKSAELGCGFGLGKRQFVVYCDNSDIIITEEESERTVKAYRTAHPEIADWNDGLWARVERAAILAVGNEGQAVGLNGTGITYHVHRLDSERFWLICTLPSGRHIAYYRPKVRLGQKWGRPAEILSFRTEWNGKSYREDTYGGKEVENIVQGTARDIMCCGAVNAEDAGYPIIGLSHDEVITLPPLDFGSHQELCTELCRLPAWVTDCPVEAEGGTMQRYGK